MRQPDRVTRLLALIGAVRTEGIHAGAKHSIYSAALEAGYTRKNISTAYQAVARAELKRLRGEQK